MKRIIGSAGLALAMLMMGAGDTTAQVTAPAPYGVLPSPQQVEWQAMDMYAFVHFTVNTFTNKEWGYGDESEQLFNPTGFDADQIVSSIKSAGLTGLILTCKHHDGFCLWPTKTTEHNITKSPWKNGQGDMVKEFAAACQKQGIKFGVYLSPWDRNSKDYGTAEYIRIYREQLKELLTNYGPVFEIWHDGANGGDGYYGGARKVVKIDRYSYYKWPETWGLEKQLQPGAVIMSDVGPDVRWVGTETGFSGDPCWATYTPIGDPDSANAAPGQVLYELGLNGTRNGKQWMPAETNFSIRPGWFYHATEDDKVKTPMDLLNHYFSSVGHGTTMLLNVPPDQRGLVNEIDAASLKGFGDIIRDMYSVNYAAGATVEASSVRSDDGTYAAQNVLDNDPYTYWGTKDGVTTGELVLKLAGAKTFNVIRLRENIKLGQRIDDWAVDVWENGKWAELKKGTAIGYCRLIRSERMVTTDRIRVRITKGAASICLSDVALFKGPEAQAAGDVKKPVVDKHEWKVGPVKFAAAIDSDEKTAVQLDMATFKKTAPKGVVVDMQYPVKFEAITYLPVKDKGLVDKYKVYCSQDGKMWLLLKAGEFSNIKANPIEQRIDLERPVSARYFRFEPVHVIPAKDGKQYVGIAELGIVK
jgi:alpha-L-fucosidase